MALLQLGDLAPDFELPALAGGVKMLFHLADRRGKQNLVLAFYPLNWEAASAGQMITYQGEREKFLAQEAEIVGISVDSIMNTTAWERNIGPFDFPLCSDFWPHGEVTRRYDVLRERDPFAGAGERAVFVVDKSGRITFRKIYPLDEVPDYHEALVALAGRIGTR